MKENLNLIESSILKIFRHNKKQAEDSMSYNSVVEQAIDLLSADFSKIVDALVEKGFILVNGNEIILTDKGDEFLYKMKLYDDY